MKRYLAALLLVVACTNERPLPPSSSVDESTPQDGGTLVRRLGGDVVTLNPVLANSLWDRYIDFYLQGRLKLDEMITRKGRLEDVNEAFRAMKAGEVARTVLTFN